MEMFDVMVLVCLYPFVDIRHSYSERCMLHCMVRVRRFDSVVGCYTERESVDLGRTPSPVVDAYYVIVSW